MTSLTKRIAWICMVGLSVMGSGCMSARLSLPAGYQLSDKEALSTIRHIVNLSSDPREEYKKNPKIQEPAAMLGVTEKEWGFLYRTNLVVTRISEGRARASWTESLRTLRYGDIDYVERIVGGDHVLVGILLCGLMNPLSANSRLRIHMKSGETYDYVLHLPDASWYDIPVVWLLNPFGPVHRLDRYGYAFEYMRSRCNGAMNLPNQAPEDTARKLADPQH